MENLTPNGEPKKIYLSKPTEAGGSHTANETSSTSTNNPRPQWRSFLSISRDVVRIPPRRHQTPVDRNTDEHLTNHKKQRYWNSWEELYLVELWRRYKDEVTIINVPLPVYRKMMVAMRNRNMLVTAQDCRRKINTLNTKYKQELSKIESTGCKSDWRLFPLIHCVMQPKIKQFDPWHENVIIKKLLDKIPKPVEIHVPAPINQTNHYNTTQIHNVSTYQPRSNYHTSSQPSAIYNEHSTRSSATQDRSDSNNSIFPFRNITMEKIEQLRQDNLLLAEQRDADLKRLQLEEVNFQNFETFIRVWTEQKETELHRVEMLLTDTQDLSKENADNVNGSKTPLVQEAVAAQ